MSEKQLAVYPGTFDPVTFGHTDLVGRAARVFDQVVVAIAESPHKKPLFSLDERITMARRAMADHNNPSLGKPSSCETSATGMAGGFVGTRFIGRWFRLNPYETSKSRKK